ncbi:MAG TPA: hypothetical protein VFB72_13125, partial [Verrucomicrobiae bacterium]|nr:hypothetical protein [Verrucomicrobiae bacterium]
RPPQLLPHVLALPAAQTLQLRPRQISLCRFPFRRQTLRPVFVSLPSHPVAVPGANTLNARQAAQFMMLAVDALRPATR